MARKDDTLNKRHVIWEAIRRIPKYKKLYALFCENDKDKSPIGAKGSYNCMMKIYREYGISNPIDPSKNSSEIPGYLLEMHFDRSAFEGITWKVRHHINTSKDRYIDLHLIADMTKSASVLSDEFKIFIKSVKKFRKERGLDKVPKVVINGKERLQIYSLDDFGYYDFVNDFRKENKRITFYNIAKTLSENPRLVAPAMRLKGKDRFLKDDKGNTIFYYYDMEGKKIENAYNRAKWCIEGGFRVLM